MCPVRSVTYVSGRSSKYAAILTVAIFTGLAKNHFANYLPTFQIAAWLPTASCATSSKSSHVSKSGISSPKKRMEGWRQRRLG